VRRLRRLRWSLQHRAGKLLQRAEHAYLRARGRDPEEIMRRRMISTSEPREGILLIVSHAKRRCGIREYGLNVYEALAPSRRWAIAYAECNSADELDSALLRFKPSMVLYNHYPATMPWLNPAITDRYTLPQMGIMHEVTQSEADAANNQLFDYYLCPDPTLVENNPITLRIPRIIPRAVIHPSAPKARVSIGSFGFGVPDKGFDQLITQVQDEFDEADISILMPFNDVIDVDGRRMTLSTADKCRALIRKPGVRLKISHRFRPKQEVLEFLARNTLNAFFYAVHKDRGISSAIEHGLAVRRPIAITRSGMFRHVWSAQPSICIEDSSLRQIISNGTAPLASFYDAWTPDRFRGAVEVILDRVAGSPEGARRHA
jgi:hypothetical protein